MLNWELKYKADLAYFQLNTLNLDPSIVCLFTIKNSKITPHEDLNNCEFISRVLNFPIYFLHQIHSSIIFYVNRDFLPTNLYHGDGLYTDRKNIFLAVRVADCLPIYFFVPQRSIIGIVHAGWRGTLGLIALKLAWQMMNKFHLSPNEIYYAFGSAIGECCYEIKSDVLLQYKTLLQNYDINGGIRNDAGKIFLNLKKINETVLNKNGFIKYADLSLCTYCQERYFYSYRRGDRNLYNWSLIGYITSEFNKFS
ncbi:MAG: peptidoglycan editing factor PgeF [candidate division WOR-3 bacterium]|nr:peptidoglycan editing factor PgeF [candidate division WOR-3 bacterium]MCX7757200.1 peptidoglycan editing factor PgeF [candidate division WOR-3 bacterium]MDW7988362.1 peptidoglycan editing factor PgeF [candidate division WOR-3 bacterium]